MESIYLNGGMNGVTLDFVDTDSYVTGTTTPSISFLTSTAFTNSTSFNLPTITSNNALVVILSGNETNPVYGKRMTTSGWDLAVVAEEAGSNDDIISTIYYKKCTTADSGTTVSYDTINRHIVLVFDNSDDYDVTVGSTNSQATRSNPSPQTISMSGLTTPVIGLGAFATNGVVSPRTYSLGSPTGEINAGTDTYAAYWIFNSSPGDRSIDMDDEGRQAMASCYLQISPVSTFGNQKSSGIWALQSVYLAAFNATGGTITTLGNYTYHTFTSSGTFEVTFGSRQVEYLVAAGGGGGGRNGGGGGGAGGFRTGTLSTTIGSYTVTVGAGGAGSTGTARGSTGSNSIFSSTTSNGGGGGGSRDGSQGTGGSGGSGGGGGGVDATQVGGAGNTPSTSPSQGNDGGNNFSSGVNQVAGGGGGANSVGDNATSGQAGAGGSGSTWLNGVTYAGGGGGGTTINGTRGLGGSGGGGNGGSSGLSVSAGSSNTGGGGGGGGPGTNGASGGSGIVIIRYRS